MKKEVSMMKSSKFVAVCVAFLVCFGGSAFAAKAVSVKTEIASFDKHGNANLKITGTVFSANNFGLSDIVSVKVGSFKFDAPVGKNYTDVDNGDYIIRINDQEVSLAINMGNFEKRSNAKVGDSVTITMKEKLGYLRTYQSRILNKNNDRANFSSNEVFANWRAVNTGKIAPNRLYRSNTPIEVADARAPYAAELLAASPVKTIINLCDSTASAENRALQVPFYTDILKSGNGICLNMGAAYADIVFSRKLYDGLAFMASHEGPYLVHGKEGKIRTGFVCTVLEALCGATIEEMDDDFMISYENLYGLKKGSSQYTAIKQTVPEMFKTISGTKKITNGNVQSLAENYLKKTVGLSNEQITALRNNLTK